MLRRGGLALLVALRRRSGTMAAPPERRFVVELAGSELAYFALSSNGDRRAAPRCFPPRPGRCYSFCLPASGSPRERVRAARLHRLLQRRLSREEPFGAGSAALALLSYSPGEAALERGFLVLDERRAPETERSLEELLRLLLPPPVHLAVYEAAEGGEVRCALWRLDGAAQQGRRLVGSARAVAGEEPALHPACAHLLDDAVFVSRGAARRVLQECTPLIPEAKAVLDLVDQCPQHLKKGNFPVIVIEGLDATGKTTLTQAVKDSLNAVLLRSPPPSVSQWRKIFDDEPTLIRRAFYALTNYILASEIAEASTKSPVIVDRYWHSTAAYAIATEISGKVQNLPPPHHQVYHWPEDLLKPDVVVLLTVSPEERIRRLQGRGMAKTEEEMELEANIFFRQKVEESYRRMENPTCQPVDASPSREEVLKAVLHLIKNQCQLL